MLLLQNSCTWGGGGGEHEHPKPDIISNAFNYEESMKDLER